MRSSRQQTTRQPSPRKPRYWKDVADELRDLIIDLTRDGRAETRKQIAAHEGTPVEVLDRLAFDPVVTVAAAALANPWMSEWAVREAWKGAKNLDQNRRRIIAQALMANRHVPFEVYLEAEAVVRKGLTRIFDPDAL